VVSILGIYGKTAQRSKDLEEAATANKPLSNTVPLGVIDYEYT
jgi:hypothetical protein